MKFIHETQKPFRHFNLNLNEKNVPPEMQFDSRPDMREKNKWKNARGIESFYGSKQQ